MCVDIIFGQGSTNQTKAGQGAHADLYLIYIAHFHSLDEAAVLDQANGFR